MKNPGAGLFSSVIEFLFPAACPLCGDAVELHGELCAQCWTSFAWIDDAKCVKCGFPFASDMEPGSNALCPVCAAGECEMDLIRSACEYDAVSRGAMLPFKHGGRIKHARFMSRAMIWAMRDTDVMPDVIMPVPLARRRLFHRGYNQASLLARPIARAYGVPVDYDSVRRKYREDMGHKTARQRAENIRGVFTVVNPKRIKGRHILVVDDVMTSGATFSEMRRVLMRAGAAAVYGLTFCRVVRAR